MQVIAVFAGVPADRAGILAVEHRVKRRIIGHARLAALVAADQGEVSEAGAAGHGVGS